MAKYYVSQLINQNENMPDNFLEQNKELIIETAKSPYHVLLGKVCALGFDEIIPLFIEFKDFTIIVDSEYDIAVIPTINDKE
jgi:hypothetical protein